MMPKNYFENFPHESLKNRMEIKSNWSGEGEGDGRLQKKQIFFIFHFSGLFLLYIKIFLFQMLANKKKEISNRKTPEKKKKKKFIIKI